MTRRNFLHSVLGLATASSVASAYDPTKAPEFAPLKKSRDEWQKLLPKDAYGVLFEEDTESPNSSALLKEHRKGLFACAACYLPLFDSSKKFDSGTGWPSFFEAIPGRVATKTDYKIIFPRTDRKSTRLNSSHIQKSRMPSSA